jgi:hypothetical protein
MPARDPNWPHRTLDYQTPVAEPSPAGFSGLQLIGGFFAALVVLPLALLLGAALGVRVLAIIVLVGSVIGINVIAFVNVRRPGRVAFALGLWVGFAASVGLIVLLFVTNWRIT